MKANILLFFNFFKEKISKAF